MNLLQIPGGQGIPQNLIFIALLIVIFYFFMIRPQSKKAKQEKEFKEGLKKGDKVVTIGGIHGKIVEVADTTFLVEIASGVQVRMEKSAISAENSQQLNK